MKIDYRRHLERAAKRMILIREVDTLIKLILRTIVRSLFVHHAVLLLYDKDRKEYIAKISRGTEGVKIPSGLVKVGMTNPFIRYFTDSKVRVFGKEKDYLLLDKVRAFLRSKRASEDKELKKFYESLKLQFSLYNAQACVPGFFGDSLICVFLLGQKSDRKPLNAEELSFLSVLSSDVVMALQNAQFFQDLNKQLDLNKKLFLQTVLALASAIEAKDKYTSGHTERVSQYSLLVAEEIRKMRKKSQPDWEKFFHDLRIASLLHDIGKIGIREDVLNKKGFLNSEERKEIEKHSEIGYSILKKVDEFQDTMLGVRHHHERFDGGGYPTGLKGRKIPLIAQIIAVADTFDAMTSDRPYRKGLSKADALEVIKENRGKQFSPVVVDAFLRLYESGRI